MTIWKLQSWFPFPLVWKFALLLISLMFAPNLLLYPTKRCLWIPLSIICLLSSCLCYTLSFLNSTLWLNMDISNTPHKMPQLINVCRWVKFVYHDIPDHGPYLGCNMKKPCWVQELGQTVDLSIHIITPPSRCCDKTPPPQLKSLINIRSSIFSRLKATSMIIILIKGFSSLTRSSSAASLSDALSTELGPTLIPSPNKQCKLFSYY